MIPLPEDWRSETTSAWPAIVYVIAPGSWGGVVTIDYGRRCFRGGYSAAMSYADMPSIANRPKGRGWQAKLETMAVEWLKQAIAPTAAPGADPEQGSHE